MNVRTNKAMLELLGGDAEYLETSILQIPEPLRRQTEEGFKEVDGCVVPTSFTPSAIWTDNRPRVLNEDDETGFECFINKVHVDKLLPSTTTISELARLGLDYAFHLKTALTTSNLAGDFEVVISVVAADPTLDVGATCSVRFHRIRAGQVWIDRNLENYKDEAIAVGEFSLSSS
jgi:hypothetical protein